MADYLANVTKKRNVVFVVSDFLDVDFEAPLRALAHKHDVRIVAEDGVLFPNTNIFAGVEDVRTHDPVERRDYVEFLDATCGFTPSDYFKSIGRSMGEFMAGRPEVLRLTEVS